MRLITFLLLVASAQAQLVGNVRTLATDTKVVLAGTADGGIYASSDNGYTWDRTANFPRYIVDRIVFSQTSVYAVLWSPYNLATGYLLRSTDSGKTWRIVLTNQPVRSVATAPGVVVAGSLRGVFRSTDDGVTWDKIGEFDQLDTVTIDRDTIYVGTWHLAYKTTDAGKNWHRINRGMADDSDVFSVLADGQTVYASACSGIYKSQDGGETFTHLGGRPASAMRTRVLRGAGNTVFAGTTDGVWKTTDGGKNWSRDSRAGIVVNDILLTPDGFLLATETGLVIHAEKTEPCTGNCGISQGDSQTTSSIVRLP